MKKQRMTIEELRELNPTPENPVRLECDDGQYGYDLKIIDVIAVGKDQLLVINGNGRETNAYSSLLEHYPSLKPEPKIETLYERIDADGFVRFFARGGLRVDFKSRQLVCDSSAQDTTEFAGSRSIKLNMDTWEIES